MVLTPLHYVLAYLAWKASRGRFYLPALALSSFIPDLEIPVLVALGFKYPYNRLVMHSILGAFTLDVALTLLMLPLYLSAAGLLLKVKPPGTSSLATVCFSALIGSTSHVLLDAMHHRYNPLFYPFTSASIDVLVLFGDWFTASLALQALFTAAFLAIFLVELKRADWVLRGCMGRMLVGKCIWTR